MVLINVPTAISRRMSSTKPSRDSLRQRRYRLLHFPDPHFARDRHVTSDTLARTDFSSFKTVTRQSLASLLLSRDRRETVTTQSPQVTRPSADGHQHVSLPSRNRHATRHITVLRQSADGHQHVSLPSRDRHGTRHITVMRQSRHASSRSPSVS